MKISDKIKDWLYIGCWCTPLICWMCFWGYNWWIDYQEEQRRMEMKREMFIADSLYLLNHDFECTTAATPTVNNSSTPATNTTSQSTNNTPSHKSYRRSSHYVSNDECYDEDGYDDEGYNQDGFDREGYDRQGYNYKGYNRKGYDRDGYDEDGLDENGIDEDGYDEDEDYVEDW